MTATRPTLILFGGHGKVALEFTKLNKRFNIRSVIRNEAHAGEISALKAEPVVQSLEDSTVDDFKRLLKGAEYVVWCVLAFTRGLSA
jgi:hypothetical protein